MNKPYEAPAIEDLGTVEEITEANFPQTKFNDGVKFQQTQFNGGS